MFRPWILNIFRELRALQDRRLSLRCAWILSSSGMLRSVGWVCTDFSGHLDPWRWDRYVIPKRRYETNLLCVTSQKTTEFSYELVWLTWRMCILIMYLLTDSKHRPCATSWYGSCDVLSGTSRFSDWAAGWTTEESWFDSRKGKEFFSYAERPCELRDRSYWKLLPRDKAARPACPFELKNSRSCSCVNRDKVTFTCCCCCCFFMLVVWKEQTACWVNDWCLAVRGHAKRSRGWWVRGPVNLPFLFTAVIRL
jgi:hypothetical protein